MSPLGEPIPIWGGLESTVVRIGDDYRDQLRETGHIDRPEDLSWIADLGITTLRHVVLWEHVYPTGTARPQWALQDDRMEALRARGITPIVGLLHHGSGPRDTNLLDPLFAARFADFAGEVADRYRWVNKFTPINEPGTTARFSCLYGHWYPHRRDTAAFLRALFNQVSGIVLAMDRIRQVTPTAQLIQTEDIGKVFSTRALRYQARYENSRRWLSFDLLCGRVNRTHPWFGTFIDAGIGAGELSNLCRTPCPPDIMGINHYLSSDRYLDDRVGLYRASARGGNGRHRYADIEAPRVKLPGRTLGVAARVKEVWRRYGLPIAITEVHNGCTREEQLRWLMAAVKAAADVRAAGIDLRALTVWALAGLVDWDSLLTRRDGHYESGVVESHDGNVRCTALAHAVASLNKTGRYDHAVLDGRGWWQKHEPTRPFLSAARTDGPRRLLIAGGKDALGRVFSRICETRGLDYDANDLFEFDICDPQAVRQALTDRRPWAVVNAAGFASAAQAGRNPERCRLENCIAPEVLGSACSDLGIQMLTFSSDQVFDGRLGRPYVEADAPNPTSAFGAAKADAERRVLDCCDRVIIVRAGELFGTGPGHDFLSSVLSTLEAGREFVLSEERLITPAYLPDVVHRSLDLLIDGERGIWHLANAGAISRGEFARGAAVRAGLPPTLVIDCEDRGASTELASERGPLLPPLASALDRFFVECRSA